MQAGTKKLVYSEGAGGDRVPRNGKKDKEREMKKKILVLILAISMSLCSISAVFAESKDTPSAEQSGAAENKATATEQLEDLFTTIDLMDASISDLQDEMTAGHVTSVQLTQMYIDRIKAYDGKLKLNSIISINPDALIDAEAMDCEREEGKVRGPLHGIPVIVKANYDVAGMATTAGSNALVDMIAAEDAFVVKKLKDAGAVILAQANMSEFASSAVNSSSTLGGTVHNAYDGSKTPAGSSGGTAVAVTCNFAAAGLGTDTGGSIRNPSSFSDLYGIRPSKGLTSISGVIPLSAQRDTTGPMARTAEDMALILQTIAGTDPDDDFTQEANADALLGDGYTDSLSGVSLKGIRIGYLRSSFSFSYTETDEEGEEHEVINTPDPKIDAMIKSTRARLRKAGAVFVDMSDYLTEETVGLMACGAQEDSLEYDLNKYLDGKGSAAPYKTLKEIVLTGAEIMYSNLYYDPENLKDSFAQTVNPYTKDVGPYKRGPSWAGMFDAHEMFEGVPEGEYTLYGTLDGRAEVSRIMKEHDIDAVMYVNFFDVAPDQSEINNISINGAYYSYIFGPSLGLPEISLPMGFSETSGEYTSEMPLGMSIFSDFGNEETLMQIAYAYEKQEGADIRKMPERTPALKDENLNAFLENLMEDVYSIDYSAYKSKPEGKVQLMLNAYEKAKNVNTKDPYATYEAAGNLARAYDRVVASLEESGRIPAEDKTKDKAVGDTITYGNLKYRVTSAKADNRTVSVTGMKNKNKTAVTIPATVKYDKYTYKVTAINANAFRGNKKLRKVTIGTNVEKIGKNAFRNCTKLSSIRIKTKKLSTVGAGALKGISKKAVIRVPGTKKKAYAKLFSNKGLARTVKIKKL